MYRTILFDRYVSRPSCKTRALYLTRGRVTYPIDVSLGVQDLEDIQRGDRFARISLTPK